MQSKTNKQKTRNERKIKAFSDEGKLEEFVTSRCFKRIAKKLKRKKNKGILEHQEGRKNVASENISLLEFSKFCLKIEAKISLFYVVRNIYRGTM